MLKRIKYFFSTEAGLRVRMTLWVSIAVLIVAAVVMTVASSMLSEKYESALRRQLSDDIDATTRILDERMKRVEYITRTAASFIEANRDALHSDKLDAMLYDMMKDVDCIDAASFVLDNKDDSTCTVYNAINTVMHNGRNIVSVKPERKCLDTDINWVASVREGREIWSPLYVLDEYPGVRLQCFSVPVYAADSSRIGMMCTVVMEFRTVDMIPQYKTRQDIDLSIYDKEGQCIVSPDDYILKLSPEDLLTEERMVDRIGWRIVYSADRHIITNRLRPIVWMMVGTVILLLIFIAIAIALAVRYVAHPFVQAQEQVASAKASMERELQIAADTQRQLVPHKFPPFPDRPEVSIHACLHPAREVGGDLYDYFIQGDRLYFCLGDVSGKGASASLFMAATHYLFRSVAAAMPISDAVQQMNVSLCTDNDACTFVTFFFGCIDLTSGMLEYCNAGHDCPMLVHNGEARYFAQPESMPLGVWDENDFPSQSVQLSQGDAILLYTDGVTEAMNTSGKTFGEDHALACVNGSNVKEPEAIIDTILQQVREHAGEAPQSDDITMLCIRFNKTTK